MTPDQVQNLAWYERFYEALVRGLARLPIQARHDLLDLLDLDTLWGLLVLLAAWAGAQTLGLGEVADLAIGGYGLYSLGKAVLQVGGHLWDFAKGAISAKSEEDLQAAGRHFAAALSEGGITALEALLGSGAFKLFARAVKRIKPVPSGLADRIAKLREEVTRRVYEATGEETAEKLKTTSEAATGIGLAEGSKDLGEKTKSGQKWLIVAAVVGGLWWLSRKGGR